MLILCSGVWLQFPCCFHMHCLAWVNYTMHKVFICTLPVYSDVLRFVTSDYLLCSLVFNILHILCCQTKSVNRMAAGLRLQIQVMDFFFFHFLFKHALCMQLSLRVKSHGLLVYRLCLLPDTPNQSYKDLLVGCKS